MVSRLRSPRVRLFPFLLLFLAAGPLAAAPAAPAPAASEPWTVDDLLKGENVRQLELSADGKLALWSVQGLQKVGKEEKRITHVGAPLPTATRSRCS